MPAFNVTIPDFSPLITYGGSWNTASTTDISLPQYQNQTYHVTNQDGATAALGFRGSGIYIYGARRQGYDGYTVTLDGSSQLDASAAAGADQFNVLLYNATSLDATRDHQVIITNAHASQGTTMDIDYIVITAGDGHEQTTSQDTVWNQDDDGHIVYSANWYTAAGNPEYYNSDAQLTYVQGAYAIVTFEGDAIGLYGTVNADHGLFSVSIDDGTQTDFNGTSPDVHFQTLLYYTSGLPGGKHTLKLTNVSPASSNANVKTNGLELDKVLVSSWSNSSVNTPTPTSSMGTRSTPGTTAAATATTTPVVHHAPTGAIAGAIIAAVAGVVLFALGLFLFCRRRRLHRNTEERQNVLWKDESRADPSMALPAHALGIRHARESGLVNGSSAFISTTSSSTAPTRMLTMSYATTQASSVVPTPAVPGVGRSETQSVGDALSAASHAGSTFQATGLPPSSDENPHFDFPPPEYGRVFPSSLTS